MNKPVTKIIKLFVFSVVSVTLVSIVQFGIFYALSIQSDNLVPVDAVVVFSGSFHRVMSGIQLVNHHFAPALLITPATQSKVSQYGGQYPINENVEVLIEPNARTTYENAYYASRIIKEKGYRNVILVTSEYHMPRAYLLFKCAVIGHDVSIQRAPVASPFLLKSAGMSRTGLSKMLYNEIIQFWGSMLELGYHKVCGRRLPKKFRRAGIITLLEKTLLLRVK